MKGQPSASPPRAETEVQEAKPTRAEEQARNAAEVATVRFLSLKANWLEHVQKHKCTHASCA